VTSGVEIICLSSSWKYNADAKTTKIRNRPRVQFMHFILKQYQKLCGMEEGSVSMKIVGLKIPHRKTTQRLLNGFVRGYSSDIVTYLTFGVNIRTSILSVAPYSNYQQFLYDTISEFRNKDWTFKQIAGWLNNKGYTSARGKKFGSSHVHSIIKKRRLRDQQISKESKMIISNFDLRFLDRTLTNQI